jgi:hypothetical protein
MSTTGVTVKIGTYSGTTPASLGGKIVSSTGPEKLVLNNTMEPSTGTRQADLTTTGVYWKIPFKMKIQKLTPFINTNCFITAEGTLPSFNLYYQDGLTKIGFTSCYVDTCKISKDRNGFLTSDIVVISLGNEVKDLTITPDTETPMSNSNVTTFSIGGTSIAAWDSFDFSVNNHVTVVSSGNGDAATDIYPAEATYEINAKTIKKAALAYGIDDTITKSVVFTLTDNQIAPVAKTYTFANANISSNSNTVESLGIVYENIRAVANGLVIS